MTLRRISASMDAFQPCEDAVMSEEYVKEYVACVTNKKGLDMDAALEDARADMECCHQCDNKNCPIVQLRKLVKENPQ